MRSSSDAVPPSKRRVISRARLERRAFVRAARRCGRDGAATGEVAQPLEDLRQIGKDARDRGTAERTGEIAILAVRRAPFGEMELEVGARRNRLQLARPGGETTTASVDFVRTYVARASSPRSPVRRFAPSRSIGMPSASARATIARPCSHVSAAGVTSRRFGIQRFGAEAGANASTSASSSRRPPRESG